MKKLIFALVILHISILNSEAQESFSSYRNEFHGFENQIFITQKQQNFTLWITGLSMADTLQNGGVAIKQSQYLQFHDALIDAQQEYGEWKKSIKSGNDKDRSKTLKTFIYGDAFFKDKNWHYSHNILLKFELEVAQYADSTKYYLMVSTGPLKSAAANSVKSPGFRIVFSNEEEISHFIESISTKQINDYLIKLNPKTEEIKQAIIKKRTQKIEAHPWLSHIEYGVQGSYYSAFNMNSISSTTSMSLKLIEPLIPSLEGYSVGVFGRVYLNKFVIQPEILYNLGKGISVFTFADISEQQIIIKKETKLRTLDVPLLIGYNFLNKNKWKISLLVGPQLKFNIGSTSRFSYFHTLGDYKLPSTPDYILDFQPGVSAAVMVDYSRFYFGLRYHYFKNMIETAFDTQTHDQMLSTTLAFTVGWKIFEPIK